MADTLSTRLAAIGRPALLPVMALIAACSINAVTVTPEQAAQAQVFNTRCSVCHALPAAKRYNYAQWRDLLGIMEQRMQERGLAGLGERDRNAILAYLKRNGR